MLARAARTQAPTHLFDRSIDLHIQWHNASRQEPAQFEPRTPLGRRRQTLRRRWLPEMLISEHRLRRRGAIVA